MGKRKSPTWIGEGFRESLPESEIFDIVNTQDCPMSRKKGSEIRTADSFSVVHQGCRSRCKARGGLRGLLVLFRCHGACDDGSCEGGEEGGRTYL